MKRLLALAVAILLALPAHAANEPAARVTNDEVGQCSLSDSSRLSGLKRVCRYIVVEYTDDKRQTVFIMSDGMSVSFLGKLIRPTQGSGGGMWSHAVDFAVVAGRGEAATTASFCTHRYVRNEFPDAECTAHTASGRLKLEFSALAELRGTMREFDHLRALLEGKP